MTSQYLPIEYKPQTYTISLRTPVGNEERIKTLQLMFFLSLALQIEGLKKPLEPEENSENVR